MYSPPCTLACAAGLVGPSIPTPKSAFTCRRKCGLLHPDAFVTCRPNPDDDSFQDNPAVIVEVLSAKTRRIDEGEKKDAYLTIPSLRVYLLVEQETAAVVAFRRTEHGFLREVYEGLDAVIPLGEIETVLPLAEMFETIEFHPEPSEDEV